jgi:hypothetical protein
VIERRGRRRRKLLDDLKERRGYSHLKEKALDRTMWRARFGRGFGPVVMPVVPCWPEFFGHLNLEIAGLQKDRYIFCSIKHTIMK